MDKLFTTLIVFILPFLAVGQERNITGTVTSGEDASPLPGVNVVVKGTTTGTVTDIDGRFSLNLGSEAETLVFSFVGFETQEIPIGASTTIDVVMEVDSETLEEVVVVGYGIQKKTDVTGATATVSGEELVKQQVLTPTQAIQGKVAGVQIISNGQPGTSPQIRVRGIGTALGGTTTLYVVDGVLTDDISNINTADIVDMSILKDASAAAIYGSRGANGVVIITTRKGSKEGIEVNYNNSIGFRQAANLVEMANAEEYRNYVQAATGSVPPASEFNTNWYDEILRTAMWQNHNLSLSGGNEKARHLLNFGYLGDEGIVINNRFKRLTLRYNTDYNITDKVTFGLQSSYANSINENAFGNIDIDAFGNIGPVYNNAYRAAPIIASVVDGRYGNTSAYQNVGNPVLDVNNNSIKVRDNRLQGSSYLEVKPLEWITVRSQFGADWRNSLNRGYYYQFNADEETFLVSGGNQNRAVSSLNIKQTQTFRWVWDNTVTLNRKFGNHDFSLLAGTTAELYTQTWVQALRNDVPADENLWYIGVGDANSSQNDGRGDAWARNSYLTRLNYAYDEKYLLTATLRYDGSSRFPGANRWQQFPSFGLGWIISREGFMQNQDLLDFLKLRASYGRVGNDQIPTDAFTRTVTLNKPYSFGGSSGSATNGAQINQIIDPNITWEITEEYDLAVEFGLFESRLSGEVNYYDKRVENALIGIPIPRTVGDANGEIITNVASIQNRGIEVLLNWKNSVSEDFSYNIGANATFNRNEVLELNGGQAIWGGSIGAAQGYTTYTDNGQPVGSFYVLQVLGVFNNDAEINAYVDGEGNRIQPNAQPGEFKYLDKNNDGQIDDNDRVFAGSYQPVAYFGLNLGANYKNWDLSMDFYGNVGNEVYNGKRAVRVDGRDNIEKELVYNRWTSANRSQEQPGASVGNMLASTYFVEPGDFVRLNNITLGYTVPAANLERYRITGLRFFATSQNLFTLQRYSGFTPELPGDPLNSGIELSAYPMTRTVAVGVNIGF